MARSSAVRTTDDSYGPLDPRWLRTFRARLVAWFQRNQRSLPWRRTRDPYHVWISEIMLQQTQVATVIPYFERFIARWPTVADLATAPEDEVLRCWEGLGYYRRARQLHQAARQIVTEHRGLFPRDPVEVRRLPGIGRYTAGAILSIAFDAPEPILEANTFRLYARLLAFQGDPRTSAATARLWEFAEALLPRRETGRFNQALMELGSLVCTPRTPDCAACPVASLCPTRAEGLQSLIPPPLNKPAIERRTETAVVIAQDGRWLLLRRPIGERWGGLWDFVRFEAPQTLDDEALIDEVRQRTGLVVTGFRPLGEWTHGVTRYRITLSVRQAEAVGGKLRSGLEAQWASPRELEGLPLSVSGRRIGRLLLAETAGSRRTRRS